MFSPKEMARDSEQVAGVVGPCFLEVLRASGIRAFISNLCTDDRLLASVRDGLPSLVALLDAEPRCRAQLITAPAQALRQVTDRDTWVLVPFDEGWAMIGHEGVTLGYMGQSVATVHRGFRKLELLEKMAEHTGVVIEVDVGLRFLRRRVQDQASTWFRLMGLLKLERREIGSLLVYAILLGGLSLAVPTAVQVLVNSIAMAQLVQPLMVLAFVLLGVLCLDGLTKLLRAYSAEILARRLFVRIAEDFCVRIPRLERRTREPFDLGERAQRFFETITIQKSLETLVVDGFGLALSTLAGLALLAFYHPLLLAFDAALILGFLLIAVVGRGALASAELESRSKYRVAAWVRELAMHPSHFQSSGGQFLAQERANELISDYLRSRKIHYRKLFRQLVSGVGVYALAMVTLLGLGGYLVMLGELSLGQLVAAEIVVGVVVKGFTKIGKHLEKLYDLHAALGKVGMVVDLPLRDNQEIRETPVAFEVAVQTLDSLDAECPPMRFEAGGSYQIAGARAESLMALRSGLLGYRLGPEQRILDLNVHFQERPTIKAGADFLAESSMVLERTSWSELSILDQLRLQDPGLNQASALRVLERVGLANWLRGLTQGVHSQSLHMGCEWTPQRQAALLLARAILAQPPLIIEGDWLDSSLIGREEKQRLQLELRRSLPRSVILTFVQDPSVGAQLALTHANPQGVGV